MNAVVYARYSSHKQGEQSIEGQIAAAYQYAGEHGYTIIHEYIDRAQTGRNDDREQFQQMLKDTAKRQFEVIIIWKIDRFGRNREEIAFNKYRCKKNGVKVLYTAESIPDTPKALFWRPFLREWRSPQGSKCWRNDSAWILHDRQKTGAGPKDGSAGQANL